MYEEELFGLVYLSSIGFYFDTKSGCFYGSLLNGNQEETLYDFTMRDCLEDKTINNLMKYLNKEEAKVINDYLLRIRSTRGFIYND